MSLLPTARAPEFQLTTITRGRPLNTPNILFIVTDEHNPHIAGFADDPIVDTPALDRLAGRSTFFESAYCQSPLCVPSRYSFLTGKYVRNCSGWGNGSILFPEHATMPGWLGSHGYETAAVGKMHFKGKEQMHGWGSRPYGDLVESRAATHQPDPPETADGRWNRHSVGRFPFAGPTHIPESMLVDQVITTESLAWMHEYAASENQQPWLFCASFSRPHFPLTAPGRYIRKYLDSNLTLPEPPPGYPDDLHPHDRFIVDDFNLLNFSAEEQRYALACYYACVDYVDDCIGALLEGFEKAGCLDNMYVVYTSDHGDMAGEHGLWWKRTYYDGSAGVPLLISGPDVPHGKRVHTPVELVDLFPTMCEWANIEKPESLDGESLNSLLGNKTSARKKTWARSELFGGKRKSFRMIRDERWKLVEFPEYTPRLFDLKNDPDEMNDLAHSPPPDAPVKKLRDMLNESGSWTDMEGAMAQDKERSKDFRAEYKSKGAVQYRSQYGKIIEADAHLYPDDNK